MPNGKPLDHAYTDIVVHGTNVFGEEIDSTVRRLARSLDEQGRKRLGDLIGHFDTNLADRKDAHKRKELMSKLENFEKRQAGEPRSISMSFAEKQLGHKLLSTLHLNVRERASLPRGSVGLSALVEALDEVLERSNWFPSPMLPGHDIGDGAVIERRGTEIWVHEQHEIGVARFGRIESTRADDVASAIRAYVRAHGGSPIDGVEIDWSR